MSTENNTVLSAPPNTDSAVGQGTVLRGRFVLEEELQQGRLGVVYSAGDRQRSRDDGSLHRVAILIVPSETVRNPRQLESFKREFSSVQALSHPNIVALLDFDCEGETYFLVMEFVDGESLRSILDCLAPEWLSEDEALYVVLSVGEALIYAHAKDTVHGDVRAENVLITEQHEIKLLFASACLARSAPFSVDQRDDVYGLASLAYELLAGERPPIAGLPRSGAGPGEPPRSKRLSRARWNALRAGLAVREGRTRTVRQLLEGLGIAPRRIRRGRAQRHSMAEPRVPERFPDSDGDTGERSVGARILRRAAVAAVIMAAIVAAVAGMLYVGRDGLTALTAGLPSPTALRRTEIDPLQSSASTATISDDFAAEEAGTAGVASADEPAAAGERRDAGGTAMPQGSAVSEALADGSARESGRAPGAEAQALHSTGLEAAGRGSAVPPARVSTPAARDSTPAARDSTSAARDSTSAASDSAAESPASVPDVALPTSDSESSTRTPIAAAGSERAPLAFARREIVATEGQGVVPVEIRRAEGEQESTVVWWTSDATATASDDYADFGRVVEVFRPGELSRTLLIPIVDDGLPESSEIFHVNLSGLSEQGAQQGELLQAVVTIIDDDS